MSNNSNKCSTQDAKLASTKRLIMFSNIAGPVSLIIGGVLLSGAGLICAFLARRKINELLRACAANDRDFQQRVLSAARPGAAAIIICAIALLLNAISVALMLPMVLSAMQSGNLQALLGGGGTTAATSITSTWG